MLLRLETVKKWRWDLIGLGLAVLFIWSIFTPPSAYFLHFDTLNQDIAALEWSRDCWIVTTEKMLPVFLLGLAYKIFGVSPFHETAILSVLHILSIVSSYELTRLLSKSKLAGLFAALLLMALPAFQFFSRTYMGYIAPWLLLGWLAIWHDRWGWAGLCFGLAVAAHFYTLIPLALSIAAMSLFWFRPASWKKWLKLSLGIAAPLLATEIWYFVYMGHVYTFIWIGTIWKLIFRQASIAASQHNASLGWLWLPQTIVESNGVISGIALALGVLSPFFVWQERNKTGLAFCLTSVGLVALFGIQAGLGRGLILSKTFAPLYPFWAIGTGVSMAAIFGIYRQRWHKHLTVGFAAALLALTTFQTGVFIHQFAQTPYLAIEQLFKRAAEAKRPVRFVGASIMLPLFFARAYGVELSVNDNRWHDTNTPGQAVLIFEGAAPPSLSREHYTINVAEVSTALDSVYPALTYAAYNQAGAARHLELWWPSLPSQPIKPDQPQDASHVEFYYPGSGCAVPPVYINRTMHFYQLVWFKLTIWLGLR